MTESQQQTAEGFAIKQFVEPAESAALPVLRDLGEGQYSCLITSEAQYQNVGLAFNQVKSMRKDLEGYFKDEPAKGDKRPGVGLCYLTRAAWNAANSLYRVLDQRLQNQETALADGLNQYDRKKQEEFERKRREEEDRRRKAEEEERKQRLEAERQEREAEEARQRAARAKSDEERRKALAAQAEADRKAAKAREEAEARQREQQRAEQRQATITQKATDVAKGPTGVTKQKNFEPVVTDLAAFLRWVVRTENWQLAEASMGRLKKHINALDGKNLPDGVRADRADIVKRGRL